MSFVQQMVHAHLEQWTVVVQDGPLRGRVGVLYNRYPVASILNYAVMTQGSLP
jgi:hypothetical protein